VASKSITTSKLSIALWADMRLLAGVQFAVPLQVMKTAKAHLAFGANVRFFLAVCQQMALKIVMARELGVAVGAFMLLGT
jgi:hypothetical protein